MTDQELAIWDRIVTALCMEGYDADDAIEQANKVIVSRRFITQNNFGERS